MFKSKKFNFFNLFSTKSEYLNFIPPYEKVQLNIIPEILGKNTDRQKFILRPAMAGEGLLSGRGRSIGNIVSIDEYNKAWGQLNLEQVAEVILQQEIPHQEHFTIYLDRDLAIFQDTKNKKITFFSEEVMAGDYIPTLQVKNFLKKWRKDFPTFNLLEMGCDQNKIWIYQALEINHDMAQTLFNGQLIHLFTPFNKKDLRLFSLLINEWKAYIFRQKKFKPHQSFLSLSFENWIYFVHYFRLSGQSNFSHFLSQLTAGKKSWPYSLARQHLIMMNDLKRGNNNAYPSVSMNNHDNHIYIGKGVFEISLEEIWCKAILPPDQAVILKTIHKVVMTTSRDILSHSFLSLVEQQIPFMANIEETEFKNICKLQVQDPTRKILIDFNSQKIEIK